MTPNQDGMAPIKIKPVPMMYMYGNVNLETSSLNNSNLMLDM